MRKLMLAGLMAIATTAAGQQLDLKVLDKLAVKAKSTTEMGMDETSLKAATSILDEKKPAEGAARKVTEGVKGFFLRSYEFKKEDTPKFEDLKPLMDQLKAPSWSRFLLNVEGDEHTEIWWHLANGQIDGMLLISLEGGELTVMNGIGVSNLENLVKLSDLGLSQGSSRGEK